MTASPKVAFTPENVNKCICYACPVQVDSQCSSRLMPQMREGIKNKSFRPEITPALYCSSGVAGCKDLKMDKPCMCATCPVFKKEALKNARPVMYYCRDGAAA